MTQTTITTQQSLLVGRNVGIALVGALIWRSLARVSSIYTLCLVSNCHLFEWSECIQSIWGPDVDVTTPTICGGAMVLCLVQLWKQYSGDKSLCWSWSWVPGVERKCPGSRSIIQNDGTHMEQSFSKSTRGKEPLYVCVFIGGPLFYMISIWYVLFLVWMQHLGPATRFRQTMGLHAEFSTIAQSTLSKERGSTG